MLTGIFTSALIAAGACEAQESTPAPSAPSTPAVTAASPSFSGIGLTGPSRPQFFQPQSLPFLRDGTFAQSKYYQNAYQQAQEYGRCVSHTLQGRADDLLKADPNTVAERLALRNLVGVARPCLPYGYAPSVIFLRGGIAEAMYLRAAKKGTLVDHQADTATLIDFYTAEKARSSARRADDRLFTAAADCLVVNAPGRVRAMLGSEHGSAAERNVLGLVFAGAPMCGTNMKIMATASTTFVRAYLAEAAYRWAALAS